MRESYIMFPCDDISLEGISTIPQGTGPFAAVVVCHPHPSYGGDMNNNVVLAICQALVQKPIVAFRFNFRGVGKSQGRFAQGIGEQEDVKAALCFIASREEVDSGRVGLAGYSFGASVALPVAPQEERVQAVAAISPPISFFNFDFLRDYVKPKLLVCGSRDMFVNSLELKGFADELPDPKKCEVVPGADHFWGGYEQEVAAKVADFFVDALRIP